MKPKLDTFYTYRTVTYQKPEFTNIFEAKFSECLARWPSENLVTPRDSLSRRLFCSTALLFNFLALWAPPSFHTKNPRGPTMTIAKWMR